MPDPTAGMHRADIMAVDDSPSNLQILSRMLGENGYKVRPVPSGSLALMAARNAPPDLILLDITMPDMDGYHVCEALKSDPALSAIPVIFLSGHAGTIDKIRAFCAGGVDYITKPFQIEEVLARVETHIKLRRLQLELENHNHNLEDMVKEQVREISELQMATIFAMANLAEYRDFDTGIHLERVRKYCHLLATEMSKTPSFSSAIDPRFIQIIYETSPLHDIGKVGIPDNILLKPAKLTPEEFEVIKTHTAIGAQALEAVREQYPRNPFIEMGIQIAKYHHEKWDGTGYPEGLSGDDIPLAARIMAVIDVYDALTSKRVYKEALPHEESVAIILSASGKQFDPRIIAIFHKLEHEILNIRNQY